MRVVKFNNEAHEAKPSRQHPISPNKKSSKEKDEFRPENAGNESQGIFRHPIKRPSPSRLSYSGVNDKKSCHTGYFEYRLDEHGQIYCRWDPVIAQSPFLVSCSKRAEFPSKAFDASEKKINRILSKIVSPYTFSYQEAGAQVLVRPRADLLGRGFILRNGKLREVALDKAVLFRLHDGNGGPKLPSGVRIVEFQIDDEVIAARGSDDIMYLYKPGLHPGLKKVGWKDKVGLLMAGPVRFPKEMRDWALGVSTQVKPATRRSLDFINPWTGINSYYGDDLNKTAFASTITLGVLGSDGRIIHIWDTGLPPDLHRGFITPDHGHFLGEKLSQAGSTWLLFGYEKNGIPALYQRMYDYEIFGACIGMAYAFEPHHERAWPTRLVQDGGSAIRRIPLKGWELVPFPKLTGLALITDRMSIHTCGEGDKAREIRIEGTNAQGEIGHYFKGIADLSWSFKVCFEKALLGKVIKVGLAEPEKVSTKEATINYVAQSSWQGLNDATIKHINLLKFHPYQTQSEPSTLRITLLSGKTIDVFLRTADAWSPFTRLPLEDELVGLGSGVPKILVGTIDLSGAHYDAWDPEVKKFVDYYLKPFDRVPNLLEIIADLDAINISVNGIVRHYLPKRPQEIYAPWSITCLNDATSKTFFEERALDLSLKAGMGMEKEKIKSVIEKNGELKKILCNDWQLLRKNAAKLARSWRYFKKVFALGKGFTTLARWEDRPYMGAVLDLLPRLISVHTRAFQRLRDPSFQPEGLKRALKQIDHNLANASLLLDKEAVT